ncbi:Uncharacterised protein [uncultured archaeon]|nr:Uncharacterised protein [uncultured archaeon]
MVSVLRLTQLAVESVAGTSEAKLSQTQRAMVDVLVEFGKRILAEQPVGPHLSTMDEEIALAKRLCNGLVR